MKSPLKASAEITPLPATCQGKTYVYLKKNQVRVLNRCAAVLRPPAGPRAPDIFDPPPSVWTDFKSAITLLAGPENQHVVFIQVLVGNRPVKDVDAIGVQIGATLLDQAASRST